MKCQYRYCKGFIPKGKGAYCCYSCANREGCRLYRLKTKLEVFVLFGSRCCRCGFSDSRALQLDHLKGDPDVPNRGSNGIGSGVLYGRGGTGLYVKILKGLVDISDFQLLCANCNWIKRFENSEGAESLRNKMRQTRKQKAKIVVAK